VQIEYRFRLRVIAIRDRIPAHENEVTHTQSSRAEQFRLRAVICTIGSMPRSSSKRATAVGAIVMRARCDSVTLKASM
jgi:hypothetical protein